MGPMKCCRATSDGHGNRMNIKHRVAQIERLVTAVGRQADERTGALRDDIWSRAFRQLSEGDQRAMFDMHLRCGPRLKPTKLESEVIDRWQTIIDTAGGEIGELRERLFLGLNKPD